MCCASQKIASSSRWLCRSFSHASCLKSKPRKAANISIFFQNTFVSKSTGSSSTLATATMSASASEPTIAMMPNVVSNITCARSGPSSSSTRDAVCVCDAHDVIGGALGIATVCSFIAFVSRVSL